ncbi:helix-turn-helix domain-containing protein [Flammeovirga sp. OC4]|uniref:helix-turn-helix transcriptional regulator n=1 Tax=Flammeovirga sp. OC4 TaxID=1382345 RepID=UPI0005C4A8E2|nr:helix-turn-helix domain-containing protein [Flammeovirga sp. OC4]
MKTIKEEKVIELHRNGKSYRDIAKIMDISFSSVGNIIRSKKHVIQPENISIEAKLSTNEEVITTLPEQDLESLKKTKSKKDKKAKAMKKKMVKVQNDLLNSQKELEESRFEMKRLNQTLESREQEIRLQQELSDFFEKVLEFEGKALKYNTLLDAYNFLWEWKEEISTASLFKTFKEEYILATKLSDYFEKGLLKFDESTLLKEVRFNFSPKFISQVQSLFNY